MTVTDADAGDVGVTVDTDLVTMGAQATTLSVTEDGQTTAAYTVVLGTEPDGPVTVTVGDDAGTPGNDLAKATPAPGALTFDASSWATAQTVTVTGAMDDDDMDETVSLAHTVTSGDPDYAGQSVDSVAVTVTDDEEPGLAVSAASAGVAVTEGLSATYTITLHSHPEGAVTVTVTSSDAAAEVDTDATRQERELTFAAEAWNTAQTVTAPVDANGINETATLSHAAASNDGDYTFAARAAENVAVTVTDTNPPGLVVDTDPDTDGAQTTLALEEDPLHADNAATYPVRLNAQPGGPVTVAVAVTGDPAAVGVAPAMLTFTAPTWNTAQTVTATAANDDATSEPAVTLSHTVAGTGDTTAYPTSLTAVTVGVTDDDTVGVSVDTDPSTPATVEAPG